MTLLALAPAVHWRMFEGESEAVVYDAAMAQTHVVGQAAAGVLRLLRDTPRPLAADALASRLLGDDHMGAVVTQDERALVLALLHNLVKLRLLVERPC